MYHIMKSYCGVLLILLICCSSGLSLDEEFREYSLVGNSNSKRMRVRNSTMSYGRKRRPVSLKRNRQIQIQNPDHPEKDYECGKFSKNHRNTDLYRFFEMDEYDYPSVLSLKIEKRKTDAPNMYCTAVLIDKQYALTAANCFKPRRTTVRSATLYANKYLDHGEAPDIEIEKAWGIPVRSLDLAVIKLKEPVTINKYIYPACLPEAESDSNLPMVVAEAPHILDGPENYYKPRRFQTIDPVKEENCAQSIFGYICVRSQKSLLTKDSICTGEDGPAIFVTKNDKQTLIGIVSLHASGCHLEESENTTLYVGTELAYQTGTIQNLINYLKGRELEYDEEGYHKAREDTGFLYPIQLLYTSYSDDDLEKY